MLFLYNLAYDNSIRNAPPTDNAVYGRVMYHFIKHCYDTYGVRYFEHWNEPDQNALMAKFFWAGDEIQLYDAYAAIATEVSADVSLASKVKLGGCSFAMYSVDNEFPKSFLQSVKTNNLKFDFLSFHPYSDTQFKGGYDSSKVSIMKGLRDTYAPNAELINGEWGRIDNNTDTWGDLDYGLNKVEHIIDMLDKGVAMSFEVALFDNDTSSNNYTYLGMYRDGPIVPKPSAYVFYNMTKMNDVLNRLPLTINTGMYGLAGINNASNKIVIVLPASNPTAGNNTVHLNVSNLPWGAGNYSVKRYELTDDSYQLGVIDNLTLSSNFNGASFSDTIVYPSVNNSGRLIMWELTAGTTSITEIQETAFILYPNPTKDAIHVQFKEAPTSEYSITITDVIGKQVYTDKVTDLQKTHTINAELISGVYLIHISMNGKIITSKIIID